MNYSIGDRHGMWTIISAAPHKEIGATKKRLQAVRVRCDCGNEKEILLNNLRVGHSKSCGCLTRVKISSGDKFNKWTAIEDYDGSRNILCRCDCGKEKLVGVGNLTRGLSRDCGCGRKEKVARLLTTHGASKASVRGSSKASSSYRNMRSRCLNPNYRDFKNWGGRGIKICDRWLGDNGFENFLADMGEPPRRSQLDRKDNDGNYCPENCRWATPKEQMNNQRNTRHITIGGVTKTVSEWADFSGISYQALEGRIRRGRPPDRLLEPLKQIYWRQAA